MVTACEAQWIFMNMCVSVKLHCVFYVSKNITLNLQCEQFQSKSRKQHGCKFGDFYGKH